MVTNDEGQQQDFLGVFIILCNNVHVPKNYTFQNEEKNITQLDAEGIRKRSLSMHTFTYKNWIRYVYET